MSAYRETHGQLYPPLSSAAEPATLCGSRGQYFIRTASLEEPVEISKVEPNVSDLPQRIFLQNGQIFIPEQAMDDEWIVRKSGFGIGFVNLISKLTRPQIAAVLAACIGLMALLYAALPIVADGVISMTSRNVDAAIGRHLERVIETHIQSSESQLPPERIREIEAKYKTLIDASGMHPPYPRLLFQRSDILKANALALPGGPIIVLDDLVTGLEDEHLIAAVLAHEIAHVQERHGIRQLSRAVGIAIIAYSILGTELLFSEEVTALLTTAVLSSYSREFESDADHHAAKLLKKIGRPSKDLIEALRKLKDICGKTCTQDDWFSTHPPIDVRLVTLQRQN